MPSFIEIGTSKRLPAVDVTTNKTLTAADQGIVQNVRSSSAVITLPATAAGLSFRIANGGAVVSGAPTGVSGAAVTVAVSPAAADAIAGNGFTATVNKDAINTNGAVGDYIIVGASGTAGVSAWNIVEQTGTWTREA